MTEEKHYVTEDWCKERHGNSRFIWGLAWSAIGTSWAAIAALSVMTWGTLGAVEATDAQYSVVTAQMLKMDAQIIVVQNKLDDIRDRLPAKP